MALAKMAYQRERSGRHSPRTRRNNDAREAKRGGAKTSRRCDNYGPGALATAIMHALRREAHLKVEEHTQGVGAIVTNLQALETALRYFLLRRKGEEAQFPKPGDTQVKNTYLTRHTSLGKLIRTFNAALDETEKNFEVDLGAVHIRDAIAHGRLVTANVLPARLWKFGRPKNGIVEIEFSEELTAEWLKAKSDMIYREKQKVLDCFAARGYQGLR